MNLIEHAKNEFKRAGWVDENGKYTDEMQEMACNNILELLQIFSNQGHSGFSANYVLNYFDKLVKWNIISPVKKEEDFDWEKVNDNTYQSKVISSVFKDEENGKPYYLEGIVWVDEDSSFTGNVENISSSQFIKLPFYPKTFYIKVKDNKIIEKDKLKEVFEYYEKI